MNTLQKKMFAEMRDKSLFEQAQKHAFQYLDEAFQRNVYPTEDALEKLKVFDEDMPQKQSDGSDVIELLHQYGSPATVSQIGGRYFGFVCGSAVPTGLAAKHVATYWDQNSAMYVLSPISSSSR